MTRRLLVSVLAVTIAFAGVAACPARALSCQAVKRMQGCCERTTLASGDCCCKHEREATLYRTSVLPDSSRSKAVLVAVVGSLVGAADYTAACAGRVTARRHGLSPPDTPVRLHTVLLV